MRHRDRAAVPRLHLPGEHEERGARDMCSRTRLRPGERVQPVPDGEAHQLVPRRMELDLVDPLAEPVVRPQLRRVLVREPPPLERLARQQRPERRTALGGPARAFALERLDERSIATRRDRDRRAAAAGSRLSADGSVAIPKTYASVVRTRCGTQSPHGAHDPAARDRSAAAGSPVLVVLDGPEYVRRAQLLPILRRLVEMREAAPHRVALVDAGRPDGDVLRRRRRIARALVAALDELVGRRVASRRARREPRRVRPAPRAPARAARVRRPVPPVGQLLPPSHRSTGDRLSALLARRPLRRHRVERTRRRPPRPDDDHVRARRGELRQQRGRSRRRLPHRDTPSTSTRRAADHDWPTWRRALDAHLAPFLRRVWR